MSLFSLRVATVLLVDPVDSVGRVGVFVSVLGKRGSAGHRSAPFSSRGNKG